MSPILTPFVPAKAGTQPCPKASTAAGQNWIPAYAGMNGMCGFTRNHI